MFPVKESIKERTLLWSAATAMRKAVLFCQFMGYSELIKWSALGLKLGSSLQITLKYEISLIKKKKKRNPKTKVIATKEDIRPCPASLKKEFLVKTLKLLDQMTTQITNRDW